MDGYKNNLEKSSTAEKGEHIPSGFSIKKTHDLYRGEDFMRKFCECLKKQARRVINFK